LALAERSKMMFSLALVGLIVPLILVCVGIVVLVALLNTVGLLLGLLWPTLPILIGLVLIWRWLKGGR